jgi:hypothetical protein
MDVTYAKYGSYKKYCRKFWQCCPDAPVSDRKTFNNYVKGFGATGANLDWHRTHISHLPNEGKLDEIGARLEASVRKSSVLFAPRTCFSTSAWLLSLHPQILRHRSWSKAELQEGGVGGDPVVLFSVDWSNAVDTWTLRITPFVLQKIPCLFTKCHYSTSRLVCGVLWVQLGSWPPPTRFFGDRAFTLISYTFIFWTCDKFQENDVIISNTRQRVLCDLCTYFFHARTISRRFGLVRQIWTLAVDFYTCELC